MCIRDRTWTCRQSVCSATARSVSLRMWCTAEISKGSILSYDRFLRTSARPRIEIILHVVLKFEVDFLVDHARFRRGEEGTYCGTGKMVIGRSQPCMYGDVPCSWRGRWSLMLLSISLSTCLVSVKVPCHGTLPAVPCRPVDD